MDATFASETQALLHVAGDMREASRVAYGNENGRGEAARGSREQILSFDPWWGGYQPQDLITRQGRIDVPTLPVTPSGTLGPAARGVEVVYAMIQEFGAVVKPPDVPFGQRLDPCHVGARGESREIRAALLWGSSHNAQCRRNEGDRVTPLLERYSICSTSREGSRLAHSRITSNATRRYYIQATLCAESAQVSSMTI